MTANLPSYHPPDPDHEPHKVLLARDTLIDARRDGRNVPLKIYYPVNHGMVNLPVILWSHGLGGSVDGAAFLSRFLAAQGYVLVHLQHKGTDSSLWEGKPGHPWDIIRKSKIPRSATLARFGDVPFVLDNLEGWAQANPEVGQHMDLSRLGMSGHSFGAMTTQAMAGMCCPDESEALRSFREPRFRAGILYSPVPIAHLTDASPDEIYGPVDLPLLHMTGTEDDSPVEGFGYEQRLTVYTHSGCREKYLHILPGGDHMVYNGSRGKLADNPDRKDHEAQIKIAACAFWDAYLKENEGAKRWLGEHVHKNETVHNILKRYSNVR